MDGEVVHELLRTYGPIDATRSGLWSQVERINKARGWIETRLLRPNAENLDNYHAQPVSANYPVPGPAPSGPTPGGPHSRLPPGSPDRRIRPAVVASFGVEKIEGLRSRDLFQPDLT